MKSKDVKHIKERIKQTKDPVLKEKLLNELESKQKTVTK